MNFEVLKQDIEKAAKQAFSEMVERHGSEEIYAFALYSDEGAMTVCPSTNTLTHLSTADPEEAPYYKFAPAEWKYESQGAEAEFNHICDQLREEVFDHADSDDWFLQFQKQLFDTCIDILETLKKEKFFTQTAGRDVFLIFTVSDYDFATKDRRNIIDRLNDNKYKWEYLDWMKTLEH